MTTTHILMLGLTGLLIAFAGTGGLIRVLRRRGMLDVPNERSSHSVPTPRGGGVGILLGLVGALLLADFGLRLEIRVWPLLVPALLIALTGYVDDAVGGISAAIRFVLQFVFAGVVIWFAGAMERFPLPAPLDFPLGVLAVPVTLIWIVGVTNLFNFLDGINGFAGLQGVLAGLGALVLLPSLTQQVWGVCLLGACLGFLVWNWNPAKIFMGDVGSATLGFIFAGLPLFAPTESGAGPAGVFVMAMLLWFFLADGAFTMIRRQLNGEKIWEPHRSHLYQRLTQNGLRHDQVSLLVHGGTTLLLISLWAGSTGEFAAGRWTTFGLALLLFAAYALFTAHREKKSTVANAPS